MKNILKPSKLIISLSAVLIFLLLFLLITNLIYASRRIQATNLALSQYLEATPEPSKIKQPLSSNSPAKKKDKDTSESKNLTGFSLAAPILMYHYIETPPATTTLKGLYLNPKIFEDQLSTLAKNNYQPLFMSEIAQDINLKSKPEGKVIILSFDDGYEDFYTQAFPLLKKYNFKSTLYIIINKLGTNGYLTREQVREIAQSGLVEIGSHTFNHPDLRALKDKDANFEISQSKHILEQISGRPVSSFAYPFGYYNSSFFAIASSSGYTNAVSVLPGVQQGEQNIWLLHRLRPGDREGEDFLRWLEAWTAAKY